MPELLLIPAALGPEGLDSIPESVRTAVADMQHFFVENERSARRYLRKIGFKGDFDTEVTLYLTDKKTRPQDLEAYFKQIGGADAGILSEAGCPGIADPGSDVVKLAHRMGYTVRPLVGPSSIFLALMASGMNGQHFCFRGYLPIERQQRQKKIRQLEQDSKRFRRTEIFMETPYRNNKMLTDLLNVSEPTTRIAVGCDLTLPTQYTFSGTVKEWKAMAELPDLHKRPTIFLLQSAER